MGGAPPKPPHKLLLFSLILLSSHFTNVEPSPSSSASFAPSDNYLINCGSNDGIVLEDGRAFKSDAQSSSYLSTEEDIIASIPSFPNNATYEPIYLSARIFNHESMYRFLISKSGLHFIRLYFYPLPHTSYNLTSAAFTVSADDTVLLHGFSLGGATRAVFKEYLVNATAGELTLRFSPMRRSAAFVNAVEVVSAPEDLVADSAAAVSPAGEYAGVRSHALEVAYRLNVGGPAVTPKNDTLRRTWLPSAAFMAFPEVARNVSVPNDVVRYPKGGATPLTAPYAVYATAAEMADSETSEPNFNLTWIMAVDPSFSYLIRLHFCDIVSNALNELYFNVYVNGVAAAANLDLSTLTSGLATPYYKDLVLNSSAITNATVVVQVGPASNLISSTPNAILNGLEVMKMSNAAGSLDGLFSAGGAKSNRRGSAMRAAGGVGLGLGLLALILLSFMAFKWCRRPKGGYEKQKTFSSWLLPLSSTQCSSFMSSKSKSATFSSSIANSGIHLGRFFTLAELKQATNNFDDAAVVGVGGFGKVYLGEIDQGTKIAIKRGSSSSSQGINEFQTEIQLLSKLRHRHLVSLIGYCDEQAEMILVYEYMSNGPLRDHLYGSSPPPLPWRKRLEICIGAARGLHYLHTGSAQGIIHRDVKTTNILLDEGYVAKVSDFGLSKMGPTSLDQTHVSTAVKGSFGYLDPEYFRRQQLTEKSDVYSFGVVLFEVLCARAALDPGLPRERVNLAEWAKQENAKGSIAKIVDPAIAGSIAEASLAKYVEAAEKCLAEYGVDRPSMGDVLWNLEYALQLQDSEKVVKEGEEEGKEEMMSEDSGVVASPLFLETFQAR